MRYTMNTTIKRLLAILLCFMLVFSFAEDLSKTLTLGIVSTKSTYLNPLFPEEKDFMSLSSLIYEGLVEIDDNYMPSPRLAKSWDSSSDGGTWTFYLRDDATFSDGTPVTAQDVVDTANTIISVAKDPNQTIKTAYSSLRYFVKSISASDSKTLVIKTDRRNFGFLYAMTFPVLPSAEVAMPNPKGSGPYMVENFEAKDLLMLSLREGIGKHEYTPPFINVVLHESTQALMTSYEFNRIESLLTRSITAAQYRSGTNSLNFHFRTRQLETLIMNNSVLEFSDIRVRQALRYALNIDEIASYSYFDLAERTDTPLYPSTWTYNENIRKISPSMESAIKLLEEAGWEDSDGDGVRDKMIDGKLRKLRLRFMVYEESDNNVRIATANQIAGVLKQLGIQANSDFTANVKSYDDVLASLKAGSFDLALVAFNMDTVPDPGFLLMTRNTGNFARYSSSDMDNLFNQLRKSVTKEEYQKTLYQIQELYYNDCPFICLYYRRGAILTRKLFTKARDLIEPDIFRGITQ